MPPQRPQRPKPGKPGKPVRPAKPEKQMPPPVTGETIELDVDDMAQGGSALGRYSRKIVLVPYAIPGERLRAKIVRQEETIVFAEGVMLLSASGDRVMPQCPHFGPGRCRGCQWQHIDYPAQLLLKQDVLVDALSRLGGFDDRTLERAIRPVVPAPERWWYNYRTVMDISPEGKPGYPRTDGQSIEPVDVCHVLHPELQALYEKLDMDFPDVKRVHLVRGSAGETMLMLEMKGETMPELSADFPVSVNVILPDNEPANLVGDTLVTYTVGERSFRVTAGSYFRANVPQVPALVQAVTKALALTGTEKVLDLYAGVGVFTAFMAQHSALVTLVESYPPAATDAEANLEEFDNVDIIEGAVEEVLADMVDSHQTFDVAVIDPPGSGLGTPVISRLIALRLKKLVYISSNPAALARDGKALAKAGYRLTRVQPVDFSPHSWYVDAVTVFEKK